jgi:TolB protein
MKKYLKLSAPAIFLLLLMFSCNPEGGKPSPGNYEIYLTISSDQTPAISPDGKLIAYYHQSLESPQPATYPTGLYIMDSDGLNRRLLLKGYNWGPSWSPDGQWLVFTNGALHIINLVGDSIRTFSGINNESFDCPDWSKDGKFILFSAYDVNEGGVFVCDPLFKNARILFTQIQISGFSAKWSPERSKIVFEKALHTAKGYQIYIIDTIGAKETRLTNDDLNDRDPSWSPDGKVIAWSRQVHIAVMNTDGKNIRTLDYGRYPEWSPDSKYIIYSNANSNYSKEVLWRVNIDDSQKKQLTF